MCTQKLPFSLQPQNEHGTYALFRSLLCESDQAILDEILLGANLRRASALLVNPNVSMTKILQDMFAKTHEKYMKSKTQLQELEEKYRKLQDSLD
jgi:hypothetical protein